MKMLQYLKSQVKQTMRLPELIGIFEKMCRIPIETVDPEDDLILFETGTFSFSGESMFHVSLVRQFPNGEDEYFQIHLDIQYAPDDETRRFSQTVWNEEVGEDFFAFVRNSAACQSLKYRETAKIDVFMDET